LAKGIKKDNAAIDHMDERRCSSADCAPGLARGGKMEAKFIKTITPIKDNAFIQYAW